MELIHPLLDNDLGGSWRASGVPSAGAVNIALTTNVPPQIRQVRHSPVQPVSGTNVMRSPPTYHLLAQADDVFDCQYTPAYDSVLFHGTLVSADHAGMVQWLKDFMLSPSDSGGSTGDNSPGYGYLFLSNEVTDDSVTTVSLPNVVEVDHTYRVRCRMKDVTGRWSHWSAPVEFSAGPPDDLTTLREDLRVSEVMYNPQEGSDYEFVELRNTGTNPLDIADVALAGGIDTDQRPAQNWDRVVRKVERVCAESVFPMNCRW